MNDSIKVLASAIHDAKNHLFFADTLAAAVAENRGIDLAAVREALGRASTRLTRALMAYRLDNSSQPLSISAVPVHGLLEDAASICGALYTHRGLSAEIRCDAGIWPLDRDLILDVINNGLENAARFAKSTVDIHARQEGDFLFIRIEDDGPGYGPDAEASDNRGLGLHIGGQIARLHRRHGREGALRQYNGGNLGGAVLELKLP